MSRDEILIVEDSSTQAEQLKYLLEKGGFDVVVAQNGLEALSLLKELRPMIIISDILMPEMDGYQLCRHVKSDENLKGIPFIMLTSLFTPDDIIRGLESGTDNFLSKPCDEEYLISMIQNILINKKLRANSKMEFGMDIYFSGKKYCLTSDRLQIIDLLISTYEISLRKGRELEQTHIELNDACVKLGHYKEHLEEMVREKTQKLEEALLTAGAANRAKSEFLANMSHELRTPLNHIIGFSEMMREGMTGPLTDKQKEYAGDIAESGNRLLSLLNEILDLSRIETGEETLEKQVFNIRQMLERCRALSEGKALKHKIKVSVEVGDGVEGITADQRKIKQVVVSLLDNALKFTPDGGSVRLSARMMTACKMWLEELKQPADKESDPEITASGCIKISVKDTGIGISEEEQKRLFKSFQQLESAYTKTHGGAGLGLYLSKRLVEMHGGRIWVESEKGKGSKFVFIIPQECGLKCQMYRDIISYKAL